jgi:hypothetical protein
MIHDHLIHHELDVVTEENLHMYFLIFEKVWVYLESNNRVSLKDDMHDIVLMNPFLLVHLLCLIYLECSQLFESSTH